MRLTTLGPFSRGWLLCFAQSTNPTLDPCSMSPEKLRSNVEEAVLESSAVSATHLAPEGQSVVLGEVCLKR